MSSEPRAIAEDAAVHGARIVRAACGEGQRGGGSSAGALWWNARKDRGELEGHEAREHPAANQLEAGAG